MGAFWWTLLLALGVGAMPPVRDPWIGTFPKPVQLTHVQKLILDPGHGGENLGALGALGVREKALTLDVARHIAAFVRARSNVQVVLTREKDVAIDLRERPRRANEQKGDALISIHANAHETPDAQGMEVFFLAADASVETARALIEREEGIEAGQPTAGLAWSVPAIVMEMGNSVALARSQTWAVALADALQRIRPATRFRGVRQAPFGVLKEARMPAVVLEVGYITHPQEARILLEERTHAQFGAAVLLALQTLDRQIAAEQLGRPTGVRTGAAAAGVATASGR